MGYNNGDIQKLYNVVHEAGLYTKSFDEFSQKYNSPENIDKLYSVVNQAGLYTKTKDEFYGKYYPSLTKTTKDYFNAGLTPEQVQDKEAGRIATPIQPQTSTPTSESTRSIQPQQSAIQSGIKAETSKLKEQNVNDAIESEVQKNAQKYQLTTPEQLESQRKGIKQEIDKGHLVVSAEHGKPVLKRGTGFLESFSNAVEKHNRQSLEDNYLVNASDKDKIEYLNRTKEHPETGIVGEDKTAPSGVLGQLGEFLGENAPFLAKGAAGAIAGTASGATGGSSFGTFLSTVNDLAKSGYSQTLKNNYYKIKANNPELSDEEALDKAKNTALAGEATSIASGAILAKGLPESKVDISGVLNGIKESAKHTVQAAPKVLGSSAGASVVNDLVANTQGAGNNLEDILKNAGEATKNMAVMHFGLWALTEPSRIPSYLRPQVENVVASAPREQVKEIYKKAEDEGVLPEGTTERILNKLDEFDEQKKAVDQLPISEEKKAAITGKLLQKKKLTEDNEEGKNDEQIKQLDEDIKGIFSGNTFDHERDEINVPRGANEEQDNVSQDEKVKNNNEELQPQSKVSTVQNVAGNEVGGSKENVGQDSPDEISKPIELNPEITTVEKQGEQQSEPVSSTASLNEVKNKVVGSGGDVRLKKQVNDAKDEDEFIRNIITDFDVRYKNRKDAEFLTEIEPTSVVDANKPKQDIDKTVVKSWEERIDKGERPPIIIRENGEIDGQHKLEAYKNLQFDEVPVIYERDLRKFYKDNKTPTQEVKDNIEHPNQDEAPERSVASKAESESQQPTQQENIPPTPTGIEPAAEPIKTTSVKNEVVNQERAAEGKEPVKQFEKYDSEQSYNNTKERVDKGEIDPRSLAQAIAKDPKSVPITHEVTDALAYDRMRLSNEYEDVLNKLKDNPEDAALFTQKQRIEADKEANDEAARHSGTVSSHALLARKKAIAQDYTALNVVNRYKVANGGKITPEEEAKVKDLADQVKFYDQKVAELEEQQKLNAEEIKSLQEENRKLKNDLAKEKGSKFSNKNRPKTKEDRAKEREDLFKQLAAEKEAHKQFLAEQGIHTSGVDFALTPKMVKIFAKLARNYVEEGVSKIEDIVDAIYEKAKDIYEGIDKRTIRDAITGYGRTINLSQEENDVRYREVKRQGRLVSALEDAEQGQRPVRSGLQRDKPSPRVKELEQKVKVEMRKHGIELNKSIKDPEERWRTALEAYKTRLKNETEFLDETLKSQDLDKYLERKKRKQLELDEEALKLKAERERKKRMVDMMVRKRELANRSGYVKTLDWLSQWRRAILLTGTSTLGKLQVAATGRMIISPLEELEGWAISKVPGLNKIAAGAPREGGFNPTAEAKAISQLWQKATYEDIRDIIKSGKGRLDELFGKHKDDLPPSAIDFFGQVHQALKAAPKRAEFYRSFEKRTEFAIKEGLDVTNPVVQATIASKAYLDANRAIFMQDNLATTGYRMLIHYLESKNNVGKGAAAVMKILLPIVKVPTNFVAETTSYTFGGIKSLPNIIKAIAKGVDSLTPEQKDYVIRNLKKQGLGAAFIALGYFNAQNVGGYYQDHEKRKDEDVKAGRIRIFGWDVPSWAGHIPLLEALQFGATLRRVQEDYQAKGKENAVGESIYAGGKGLVEEVPFAEQPVKLAEELKDLKHASMWFGDLVGSMIMPPDIAKIAKSTDPIDDTIIKRNPEGFIDAIEMRIPGLRERVATSYDKIMEQRKKSTKEKTQQERHEEKVSNLKKEMELKRLGQVLGKPYIAPKKH